SYLASDGTVAIVVDPQRDIDRVLYLAGEKGVRITHVVETHIHNDYVSGGLELARVTGAHYLVAAADEVGFDRMPVSDGDQVPVSDSLRLRVIATPGHTFHHLSYVLDESTEGGWWPVGVFTGGSLLFGTTGRTDLLGKEHAHELAHHQHASAAQAGRPAARRRPGLAHPRLRQLLLGQPGRRPRVDDRPGEGCQPGAAAGRRRVRDRDPRRP
ncbi:MBL fold metallo-hydrolase, partial [Paenibacillus apiarius]|nr:MBL fold metallo-hydrolase [Paenibacillus apiarius]